jgi:signal transduction histidine kinase
MQSLTDILERGARFIKANPQIIYTLLLSVVIPTAFVFTSEQFLDIAKENQDRLERGRVGAMQDAITVFASDLIEDYGSLSERFARIREQNPTISRMLVIGPTEGSDAYRILASSDAAEVEQVFPIDTLLRALLSSAAGDVEHSYATQVVLGETRYWRSIRALPGASSTVFLLSDVSMAEADQEAARAIRNAYLILIPVVGMILFLLARHAKIIDYATLYQRLAEIDRMKDDFVSMAAHELRAPLSVIRGYVDMAQAPETPLDELKEYLRRIDASAAQLNTLVEDILDVSRLQEGRMSFSMKRVEPSSIIVEVVNAFMIQAKEKGLVLTYETRALPELFLDPERFRQVMTNLIGNAVKYTPHGSVTVSAESDGVEVVIRVSDTGIGISAEHQAQLFSKFYRVKTDETRSIPGTGLGLWITKEIVRQMKGTISVESIQGKGTDFIVRFPIPPAT